MSTTIYSGLSDRPAMKIGGEDRPDWIIARSWQQLAQQCGIGFKLVKQTLEKTANALQQQAPIVAQEFQQTDQARVCIAAIQQLMQTRRQKLTASVNAAGL